MPVVEDFLNTTLNTERHQFDEIVWNNSLSLRFPGLNRYQRLIASNKDDAIKQRRLFNEGMSKVVGEGAIFELVRYARQHTPPRLKIAEDLENHLIAELARCNGANAILERNKQLIFDHLQSHADTIQRYNELNNQVRKSFDTKDIQM